MTPARGSLIPFVVRNDTGTSKMLFQTSDETWQAYNTYGGNSLYQCTVACPPGNPGGYKGAYKVSYNRPLNNSDTSNGLFYAEYPMIRFLEANGYDVNYTSGLDVATRGSLLTNHKVFLSVGHDEYWSGDQRANVEAARDHGLNLAFFSGNEVFWKTRWESSIAGPSTPGRTLVTYKETHFDAPVDPQDPPTWTGTWRDPRFSPPGDARSENSLTGQFFVVNSGTTDIQVPAQYAKLRLWRNTAVASLSAGQTLTLGSGIGTLGYEWDEAANNGAQPAGLMKLSSTTFAAEAFVDYGTNVAQGIPTTHNLTLYRAPSGALVFGAGTVQWSWGLDGATTGKAPDRNMQQATVNLFADQGTQPYTPMTGLTTTTSSTDGTPPTSTITSPIDGAGVADGTKVTITGTASDTGGGVVAGVEVSTDAGNTWQPATGTTNWSYTWIAHGNPASTIRTRAVDDSGNLETPGSGVKVAVSCPCSVWGSNVTPAGIDSGDGSGVEIGMKFTTETAGTITGVRFYKSSKNTGTHVGNLWTAAGQLLGQATFSNETASGWQQVTFAAPVTVTANTTYVVSYYAPVGHYSQEEGYMYLHPAPQPDGNDSLDSPPLHVLRNTQGTANGLYSYSGSTTFPVNTYHGENYWVDVVFNASTPSAPGAPTNVTATAGDASRRGHLDGAAQRRQHHHQLHRHPLHRHHRADPDNRHRQPSRDQRHLHRPDQRHDLYLHRHRHQFDRHRTDLRAVERRHPGLGARSPDECHRQSSGPLSHRHLDCTIERRQPHHQLHHYPLHRHEGADRNHHQRLPTRNQHHDHRTQERKHLHIHRASQQRDRNRSGIFPFQCSHTNVTLTSIRNLLRIP